MVNPLCPKHGLPLKNRKDKKGKFCVKCTASKAQGAGNQKHKRVN